MSETILSNALSFYGDGFDTLMILFRQKPHIRKLSTIIATVVLTLVSSISIINYVFWNSIEVIYMVSIVLGTLSFVIYMVALRSYVVGDKKTFNEVLDEMNAERQEIVSKSSDELNTIDVVKLNLSQLTEYYTINKVQAKNSFRYSVFSSAIGLILIIFGVGYAVFKSELGIITSISTLIGVFTEFIGFSSMKLYKESNDNANKFFNQLTRLQDTMLAIELTKDLSDINRESEISSIISTLISKPPSNIA